MKASRNGKVRFEDQSKGRNDTFTARACVCDEKAGFCGVINTLGGINEFADL
jgi:hypothetical protein